MTLTTNDPSFGQSGLIVPQSLRAAALPLFFGGVLSTALWIAPSDLAQDARIVLIVTVMAVVGWIGTRLPDSLVALMAALALVVTGAQPQEALTDTLGEQIVWLLLAAFVIAAVVKEAGLAERLVAPLTRRLIYGVAAKSRFPQCAYQRSENTAKLQETCTRPICMHAKTLVTSVTCGIRGRRFYLAIFPVVFRSPPKPALGARSKSRTCRFGRRSQMHESGAWRDCQDAHFGASI